MINKFIRGKRKTIERTKTERSQIPHSISTYNLKEPPEINDRGKVITQENQEAEL